MVRSGEGLSEPRSGEDFLVLVSDGEANKAWSAYVAVGSDADSFAAQRANVLVISDDGVRADTRKRTVSALADLPDRGDIVETFEARETIRLTARGAKTLRRPL